MWVNSTREGENMLWKHKGVRCLVQFGSGGDMEEVF